MINQQLPVVSKVDSEGGRFFPPTGCLHMQYSGKLKEHGLDGGDEGHRVGGKLMVLSHYQHGFPALRRTSCGGGGAQARQAARLLPEFNN